MTVLKDVGYGPGWKTVAGRDTYPNPSGGFPLISIWQEVRCVKCNLVFDLGVHIDHPLTCTDKDVFVLAEEDRQEKERQSNLAKGQG